MATSIIKAENIETYTVGTNCIAYRRGHIVTVIFENVTATSTSARTKIGTMPDGWCPPSAVYGFNVNGAGYCDVLYDGTVEVFRPSVGNVLGYVTYVTR